MDGERPDAEAEQQPLPAWQTSPGWWFRRIGIPLLVLVAIAGVIVWLERPEGGDETRRVAESDEPLEADTRAPQEGEPAPDFTLMTLAGERVWLSDYHGKVVLLNVCATLFCICRDVNLFVVQ